MRLSAEERAIVGQAKTGRSVPEWIADNPGQAIPKRVKMRIWEREGGKCYLTGRKIRPGDTFEFEHVRALADDGEHRESNIRLALTAPHKVKSADEAAARVKPDRIRAKHNGLWPKSKRPLKGRGFEPSRGQP